MKLQTIKKIKIPACNNSQGSILIYCVIIIFIFSMVMVSALAYANAQLRTVRAGVNNELAFQVAEAGVNYYQWHLAHFISDYQDGTGVSGPYIHDYYDKDTNTLIGRFSLVITPPLVGSTVVTIQSTGYTLADQKQKRTITTQYGIPSLAKYAFLTNSDAWIGPSESVSGQFHTNGGLRFDGTGNAPIYSAKSTYTCGNGICNPSATEPGIWGSAAASTQSFWSFPVPNVDFSSITSDLSTIKSAAQTSGIYLSPSNASGYSIEFLSTGKINIYKVNSLLSNPQGYDTTFTLRTDSLDYNARTLIPAYTNVNIPANGLIYVEDKTWVEGTVKGRAMVVAATLPYNSGTSPNIIIPNNIVYAAKDGTNCLGLLAQHDLLISYRAPTNLEIDAAIIAQNGRANYFDFSSTGGSAAIIQKNKITLFGSLASFGQWTWNWVDGGNTNISGYGTTQTTYDANLLYAPPPSFPLSSSGYQQINWVSN